MKKIKVLIVDDHTLVRDGIRALLGLVADIEVVGEANNGKDALEKIEQLAPDVVLMDLATPIMGGLEATRRIRKRHPETKVLALTQYDDSDYVVPVIEAGARGFVTKMADILVISPKTVEWYKASLMSKINIHSKTDLIKFAIRKGIIAA